MQKILKNNYLKKSFKYCWLKRIGKMKWLFSWKTFIVFYIKLYTNGQLSSDAFFCENKVTYTKYVHIYKYMLYLAICLKNFFFSSAAPHSDRIINHLSWNWIAELFNFAAAPLHSKWEIFETFAAVRSKHIYDLINAWFCINILYVTYMAVYK